MTLTAQCMVSDLSKLTAVSPYLKGSGKVIFANRPDGYYYARIVNQIPFEKILRGHSHCSFEVNFRCKPFRYQADVTDVTITTSGSTIINPGTVFFEPVITVYGSGDTSGSNLHLRSGTGTNYKILGKYKKGTEVIVVAKTTSTWYEVTCPDGKHGFMYASYLKYVKTATGAQDVKHEVVESRQPRDQPFRIYRVVPELDKVTVYARHIFYDLLDNMIKSLKPSSTAARAFVV